LEETPAGRRSKVSEASSPATVDRIARIQRPPIQADIGPEAVQLDEPLRGVVTFLAKRLEGAEPELVDVAMVWLDDLIENTPPFTRHSRTVTSNPTPSARDGIKLLI
jgi:hypothetical protein